MIISMSYDMCYAAYYIIGFVICTSYLIYKGLTVKIDDDIEETGFFTLMLFLLWPIATPIALFVWIQKKLKR